MVSFGVPKIELNLYLQQQQQTRVNEQQWWTAFEELYNKKLWHQLTLQIYEYVKTPGDKDLVSLYQNFISDFETKMNPLTLVETIAFIVKQIPNYEVCLALIEKTKEKVKSNNVASILCNILIGQIKLEKKDLKGVKDILEETNKLIDEETGVTPVHGRFYQLSSDYHQIMGNHCEYYRDALRYLGCCSVDDEDEPTRANRAFTLCLAALLGDSIFNFGELLQHPIIESLKGKPNEWIVELLYAFNSGDIKKFEALQSQWSTQIDLLHHKLVLRQKISLLCLMEMTFKSANGLLTFDQISRETQLPIGEVEILIMKALSLGLVRGTIDQVDAKVHLTWVQPRVLDKKQISSMRLKLDSWCHDVDRIEKLLEQKAQDIIN